MKKIVALAIALFAGAAFAAVNGSKHDMANYTNAGGQTGGSGSVCSYCHMPHNGVAAAGAPLWARNISYTPSPAYQFYTSDVGGIAAPSSFNDQTRLCLSCHDGTRDVAQTFNNDFNGATDTRMTGTALLGTDLRNDHPVSITYPAAGGGVGGLALRNAITLPLYNLGTTIECGSCHEPHTDAATAQYPSRQFMRDTGAVDFCAVCHSGK